MIVLETIAYNYWLEWTLEPNWFTLQIKRFNLIIFFLFLNIWSWMYSLYSLKTTFLSLRENKIIFKFWISIKINQISLYGCKSQLTYKEINETAIQTWIPMAIRPLATSGSFDVKQAKSVSKKTSLQNIF